MGHATPYPIDIFWLFLGTSSMGYHIRKTLHRYTFTMKKVRHLWVIIKRKWRSKWNLWVVGISHWRHHPQTTTNHLLGGRNPYLVLFWQKCLITEWFSWLIIKTALDRNQRVVTTNTCVSFPLFPFFPNRSYTSLPTHSKPKKSSIISLKKMLVATRCTTSPSSQVVMLFTHTLSYALVNL